MSDQRILELEKEMAVMQATVPPLIQKMDASTKAMTDLTGEISLLVSSNNYIQKSQDEIKKHTDKNTDSIGLIQRGIAVSDSKSQKFVWIERTFWVAICTAGLKAMNII